jgi:hypothetical protein
VVAEVRSDAGKIHRRLDPQVEERFVGADSRAQKDRRRADRASRERDSPPVDSRPLATGVDL